MKIGLISFILCINTLVSAEYFSKGWEPGQVRKPSTTANYVLPIPTQPVASSKNDKPWSLFDFGPVKSLLESVGLNITGNATDQVDIWDSRIPLITDDNYEELIVNENLTSEEEANRTWFLVITVSSTQREGISKFVDQKFDEAFNMTRSAGDLPNIRWGRIDYLNVTAITTKWAVWSAPYLVILKDRGKTLRFYKAHQVRLSPETLREFLRVEGWNRTEAWSGIFAPGGSGAYLLEWLAIVLSQIYNMTTFIPKWLLILATGSLASVMINLLHSTSGTAKKGPPKEQDVTASTANTNKEENITNKIKKKKSTKK